MRGRLVLKHPSVIYLVESPDFRSVQNKSALMHVFMFCGPSMQEHGFGPKTACPSRTGGSSREPRGVHPEGRVTSTSPASTDATNRDKVYYLNLEIRNTVLQANHIQTLRL